MSLLAASICVVIACLSLVSIITQMQTHARPCVLKVRKQYARRKKITQAKNKLRKKRTESTQAIHKLTQHARKLCKPKPTNATLSTQEALRCKTQE